MVDVRDWMGVGLAETRRLATWRPVVADLTSSDRPVESTNGAVERQQDDGVPATGQVDTEQTLADTDQTMSDAEQTSADEDQTSADSDQRAAERDQAASDRDLASGGDPHEHELSRDARTQSADQRHHATDRRESTADARLAAAEKRDAAANARDFAAMARDQAAEARTLAMAQYDAANEQDDRVHALGDSDAANEQDDRVHELGDSDAAIRAAGARRRAARHRAQAAEYRELAARDRLAAAQDRQAAAEDRELSARERLRALVDREALAREVALAETDPLTGARMRSAGLTDLDHELDRSRRTGARLVIAYVDVDGLKAVNDSQGHGAGDQLLTCVVQYITEHMRSYDLIIRVGGDEFVLAMSNMTLAEAHERFETIAAALAAAPNGGSMSTGFAELEPDETVTELIARADSDLIGHRRPERHTRARLSTT